MDPCFPVKQSPFLKRRRNQESFSWVGMKVSVVLISSVCSKFVTSLRECRRYSIFISKIIKSICSGYDRGSNPKQNTKPIDSIHYLFIPNFHTIFSNSLSKFTFYGISFKGRFLSMLRSWIGLHLNCNLTT